MTNTMYFHGIVRDDASTTTTSSSDISVQQLPSHDQRSSSSSPLYTAIGKAINAWIPRRSGIFPPLISRHKRDPRPIPRAETTHFGYPDSVESSSRSRNADSYEPPQLTQLPGGSKLRLMCSYGGHIVPRPHDKSLCYLGGDTRIIIVNRNSSLADLSARLSKSLLSNRCFTLKYQLPNEDLDFLISVTTDEDLKNMIEEYDRINLYYGKPTTRLRLFLFPTKVESVSSMGSLLEDSKSKSWFVKALNGDALLPRWYSADTEMVNCLLSLDDQQQQQHSPISSNNNNNNNINVGGGGERMFHWGTNIKF